jgi:urease accessory protein
MRADLLLLADSRLPAGGHAHSGGLEPAAATGVVATISDLEDFLRGRLATTGLVAAALSATACTLAHRTPAPPPNRASPGGMAASTTPSGTSDPAGGRAGVGRTGASVAEWVRLDGEADARTPSPAQRAAARGQGRSMLRAVRTAWPSPVLELLRTAIPGGPHQPLVIGAATAVMGGSPGEAAAITAYAAVTGPASAAVRLLGLDPLAVHATLAGLAGQVDEIAAEAASYADADLADLPALSAPVLDLFAELHLRSDLRLFES